MPGRKIPLVTGEIYHIVNRGIASKPIFLDKHDYHRALDTILYYKNANSPLRYSYFIRLSEDEKDEELKRMLEEASYIVEIIAYCLMPNHFHLLLKQIKDQGISVYMSKVSNSYTKYFNTKNKRSGPLFQGKFKAVRVETQKQLLHVSRYIHLNPFTSYVVKSLQGLEDYPHSSFSEYLNPKKQQFCDKHLVLDSFPDRKSYRKFVFDRGDYQRSLDLIKHLMLDD